MLSQIREKYSGVNLMGELYNPYPKLPKNVRQIGERDTMVKLYLEDYVNTYLKRLYPVGGQDLRVGILLGDIQMQDGTPYIFIDGAMELEDVTENGEKVVFTEAAWKRAYQTIEQMFPKRTIQGWFLCGAPGCTLSPLNYWKQHGQYFAGKNQLMYLNSGLEGDESLYVTSDDGFYQLRGHTVYYERNQMMQDYMVLRKDARRVETGTKDAVITDFRQRMEDKKNEIQSRHNMVSTLGTVCAALAVMVMAGGVVLFNNYNKMKEMESVIASVLPAGYGQEWLSGGKKSTSGNDKTQPEQSGGVTIEELSGGLSPTETQIVIETSPAALASGEEQNPGGNSTAGPEETMAAAETTAPVPETTSAEQAERVAAMASGARTHVVQPGETLYGICLEYYQNLSRIDDVILLNGLESQDKITAGQKLLLP